MKLEKKRELANKIEHADEKFIAQILKAINDENITSRSQVLFCMNRFKPELLDEISDILSECSTETGKTNIFLKKKHKWESSPYDLGIVKFLLNLSNPFQAKHSSRKKAEKKKADTKPVAESLEIDSDSIREYLDNIYSD